MWFWTISSLHTYLYRNICDIIMPMNNIERRIFDFWYVLTIMYNCTLYMYKFNIFFNKNIRRIIMQYFYTIWFTDFLKLFCFTSVDSIKVMRQSLYAQIITLFCFLADCFCFISDTLTGDFFMKIGPDRSLVSIWCETIVSPNNRTGFRIIEIIYFKPFTIELIKKIHE